MMSFRLLFLSGSINALNASGSYKNSLSGICGFIKIGLFELRFKDKKPKKERNEKTSLFSMFTMSKLSQCLLNKILIELSFGKKGNIICTNPSLTEGLKILIRVFLSNLLNIFNSSILLPF